MINAIGVENGCYVPCVCCRVGRAVGPSVLAVCQESVEEVEGSSFVSSASPRQSHTCWPVGGWDAGACHLDEANLKLCGDFMS